MDQCDVENQGGADHGGLGSQHDDAIKRSPASHEDQQDETAGNNAGEERWNELRIRPFRKEQVAKSLVFPVAEDHKSKSEGASDEFGRKRATEEQDHREREGQVEQELRVIDDQVESMPRKPLLERAGLQLRQAVRR